MNALQVSLKGVSEAIGKHQSEDSKGIKAHFRMDESGILNLENVEAVFETKVESDAEEMGNIVGDAISKVGETISKLFGGKDDETVVEKVIESVFTVDIIFYLVFRPTKPNRLLTNRQRPNPKPQITSLLRLRLKADNKRAINRKPMPLTIKTKLKSRRN